MDDCKEDQNYAPDVSNSSQGSKEKTTKHAAKKQKVSKLRDKVHKFTAIHTEAALTCVLLLLTVLLLLSVLSILTRLTSSLLRLLFIG